MSEIVVSISPALITRLSALPATELERVKAAFRLAERHGAIEESGFVRPPGQSFNPRPARIAQVLWDQAGERGAEVLAAAALSSMRRWSPPADEQLGAAMAFEVWTELGRGLREHTPFSSPHAANLFLAHRLDQLRHAHLASADHARAVFDVAAAEVERWGALGAAPQLVTLAEAAHQRMRRPRSL